MTASRSPWLIIGGLLAALAALGMAVLVGLFFVFLYSGATPSDPPVAVPPRDVTVQPVTLPRIADQVEAARGNVVIFHLYASWCPPCRREFPELMEVLRQYQPLGLKTIIVSVDDNDDDLKSFLTTTPDLFTAWRLQPVSEAETARSFSRLQIKPRGSIPYTVIYDRHGRKVVEWTGARPRADYEATLKSLW